MSLNYKQNDELIPLYQSGISPDQMDKTETDANNCVPIDTDIKVYRVGNSATNIPIQQAGIIESFVYRDSGNVRVTQRYTVNYNTSGTPTFSRTAIGDDNSLTWSAWSTFDNYSTDEQVVGRWIDGKPIYRKVIVRSNGQTMASSWANLFELSNAESIINLKSYSDSFIESRPLLFWRLYNGYIQGYSTVPAVTVKNFIIEYTKKTD